MTNPVVESIADDIRGSFRKANRKVNSGDMYRFVESIEKSCIVRILFADFLGLVILDFDSCSTELGLRVRALNYPIQKVCMTNSNPHSSLRATNYTIRSECRRSSFCWNLVHQLSGLPYGSTVNSYGMGMFGQ